MKDIDLFELHEVILELENKKAFVEAAQLNELFLKTAAKKKKKKSSGKNVPNNPELYARCKAEIKKKYNIWPSAYASGALVKLYKSRGGTYS